MLPEEEPEEPMPVPSITSEEEPEEPMPVASSTSEESLSAKGKRALHRLQDFAVRTPV